MDEIDLCLAGHGKNIEGVENCKEEKKGPELRLTRKRDIKA